jgi:hypothetical protein
MANRNVIDCDLCGAKESVIPRVGEFSVAVDRYTDAAGSMDTNYENVDMCPTCTAKALKAFLSKLSYDDAEKWYKELKKKH